MRFHEKFKNIHKGVLRQTKQLMDYNLTDEPSEVIEKFDTWAAGVCDVYDLPVVRVELRPTDPMDGFDGGTYLPEQQVILLTRPSLLILFHQFRHHMQQHGRRNFAHMEMDAHAWACSLLYQTNPDLFRRLVYEHSVIGLRMEDLQPEVVVPAPEPVSLLSEEEHSVFEDIEERFIASLEPGSDLARLMEEIADEGP